VYGKASFDAVVSAELLEHVYLPRDLVKCAFELLRPSGHFAVTTPCKGYLKNVALAISGNMDRHWTVLWNGGHVKFWSWNTIRTVLKEEGFEDIRFAGVGACGFSGKAWWCPPQSHNTSQCAWIQHGAAGRQSLQT